MTSSLLTHCTTLEPAICQSLLVSVLLDPAFRRRRSASGGIAIGGVLSPLHAHPASALVAPADGDPLAVVVFLFGADVELRIVPVGVR